MKLRPKKVAGTGAPAQPVDVPSRRNGKRNVPVLLLFAVLLMGLMTLPGCGGCNWGGSTTAAKNKTKKDDGKKKDELEETELEKKRRKKLEKPKDDFEPLAVRMLPSNDPTPTLKTPPVLVKPGHWIAVSETAKTNNFDFPGELTTFAEQQATNLPLTIEDTTARLFSSAPAILPKGQSKRIEGLFYVPRRKAGLGSAYSVRSELHSLRGGRTEVFNTTLSRSLRDYEHLIVVLAGSDVTPAAYTHFDRLLSVRMPQVEAIESEPLRHYHVMRPSVDKNVPLPSHPLAWSTIAYVFWDDLDPGVLTNLQQQALLDWVHWGGQLIISGPSSLDKLKGSFLAPYLPGESVQTVKLQQSDFNALNERFSIARNAARVSALPQPPKGEELRRVRVIEERPMVGVELKLHPAAREIDGTGGLVVERRTGGGRIVVTRFPLTDVRMKQWKSFDNFFNAVLLRRPPRRFNEDNYALLDVKWDDQNLFDMLLEPRLGSTLRYFSRDVGTLPDPKLGDVKWRPDMTNAVPPETREPQVDPLTGRPRRPGATFSRGPVYGTPGPLGGGFYYGEEEKRRIDTSTIHPGTDDWHFCGYHSRMPAGVAAWDDEGAASNEARDILTKAAGIEIPSADFVMKVLGVYLLVLVPLNWLIFWLMGKVEWAWIAAPLIALVGAGAVIRLAQLDIGFARSRTEVAVLEIQGGYERAHLTRYTALYSSLSSSYTMIFDEPTALSSPFSAGKQNESYLSIQQYTDVTLRRDKETSLAGVQVSSNSTGMVHSEQMLPLGTSAKTLETLRLVGNETQGYSVSNTTDLTIRDIGVFRRVDSRPAKAGERSLPQIEAAYVAKLEPASSAILRFSPLAVSDEKKTTEVDAVSTKESTSVYPTVWLNTWNKIPIFADPTKLSPDQEEPGLHKTRIRLTGLARLAADRLRLLPGDVRLIGWTDERLPGMKIQPEAAQNNTFTLVLAHLARGSLPAPRSDGNVAEDFYQPTADPEPGATTDPIEYEPAPGATTTTSPSP